MGGVIEPVLTVLQVLPALDGGGVERGTLEVAAALAQRGHRSLVISAGGRHVDRLEAAGSRHIAWPIGAKTPLVLRWVRPLRRLLLEERVDILHARSRLPAWVAWLAWRGLPPERRPRFLTTVHGLYSVNAYSAVMTRGERIIAVSDTARDYVLANYPGVEPERIAVIHRGVDTARVFERLSSGRELAGELVPAVSRNPGEICRHAARTCDTRQGGARFHRCGAGSEAERNPGARPDRGRYPGGSGSRFHE